MNDFTTFSDVELEKMKKIYTEKRDKKITMMIYDEDLEWLDEEINRIAVEEFRRKNG